MKISNPIGWCDETTNAVTGCDKVSPGCKNCYAATGTRARVLRAQGIETWGPTGGRMPVAGFQTKIRRLNKLCVCDRCHAAADIKWLGTTHWDCAGESTEPWPTYRRIRLFADSNSDWLDEKWALATLAHALNEIRLAPNIDILLLTKRIGNFFSRLDGVIKWIEAADCKDEEGNSSLGLRNWLADWILLKKAPPHIWLGASAESQKYAEERIPQLLSIPAAVRFLSCEPLLSRVSLVGPFSGPQAYPMGRGFNWVIVGGESGKDRRDCGVEAITDIAAQCSTFGVPVYVKQDCEFKSGQQGRIPDEVWGLKQFPVRAALATVNKEGRKA